MATEPITLADLWVVLCKKVRESEDDFTFRDANDFVEKHHYTHSVKGSTPEYCFVIVRKNTREILGASIFGKPGQVQTEDKYGVRVDDGPGGIRQWKYKLVELRRLVLADEAPKNSETRVLSIMLRHLATLGVQRVLSYADPNEARINHPDGQHTGLIYRAAGFHKVLATKPTKAIWMNGRRYPIRNIDQYNNYHSKPDGKTVGKIAWDDVPDKKILRQEKHNHGRRWVWVMKVEIELIDIAKKLRQGLKDGTAEYRPEKGKIGYLKGLVKGDLYFDSPRPRKSVQPRPDKGEREVCLCCNRKEREGHEMLEHGATKADLLQG